MLKIMYDEFLPKTISFIHRKPSTDTHKRGQNMKAIDMI